MLTGRPELRRLAHRPLSTLSGSEQRRAAVHLSMRGTDHLRSASAAHAYSAGEQLRSSRRAIVDWIEGFYNHRRFHSPIGYRITPRIESHSWLYSLVYVKSRQGQ